MRKSFTLIALLAMCMGANAKQEKVEGVEEQWKQMLTNGDAETPWANPDMKYYDSKNYTICAWGKVKMENMNEHDGWDPFPATITEDPDRPDNHVFVVHATLADTDGDASGWDNQFWIESPQAWKQGSKVRIRFRYKASKPVHTVTQLNKQNPSDFLHEQAIGDVNFTEEWQVFDETFVISKEQAGCWSIAFLLNVDEKNATDFYFDDLSWEAVAYEEGFFVTTCNGSTPDYAGAIKFDEKDGKYTATIGSDGNYVSEIMISTAYGSLAAFMGATIQPKETVVGEDLEYEETGEAVIKLPGTGVWTVTIDPEAKTIRFDLLTGINSVTEDNNGNAVKFNLAGQRVSTIHKGVVVDSRGNKYLIK